MNWLEILNQIFQLCIVPLLGVLVNYLVQYINTKKEQLVEKADNEKTAKYIELLANTINACVTETNQTYVSALKDKDAFDADAQKEAFQLTYNNVMKILSDEAKDYLSIALGDLSTYVTSKIEESVVTEKK